MFIKQKIIVFIFPLLLALPFINRAYFVDDNYFVEIAEWLVENPTLPYHFRADDAGLKNRGWEEDGFVRMVNPLLHHYYLAALIKMGGSHEWFLRLGTVLLSCFGSLFLFGLARRWTNEPLWATLIVLVTPAVWLSSYSLLIDSTMAFLFLGGLYYFIVATETDHLRWLFLSGLFMGLAILTKYTALLIIPLTGLWWILRWKKLNRRWIYMIPWVIAFSFLLAYSLWTKQLYGAPHIIAASQRMVSVSGWGKYLVFFVFLSGVTLFPLVIWGMLERIRVLLNLVFVALLTKFFSSSFGGFSVLQGFLISLWFMTSIMFISILISKFKKWIFPRDFFLMGWFLGFCAMMFVVMAWVAGRYYVIAVPPIIFLCVRLMEMRWPEKSHQMTKIVFGFLFVFTSTLAYADYKQANPSRDLVQVLKTKGFVGGDRHFYLGDSFTMSYLRGEGWVPCFPDTEFKVGDKILSKEVTMPLVWFAGRPIKLQELAVFEYPTSFLIKVMDYQGSAGFYASVWGALPFTIASGPWERFRVFEVSETYENK